MGIICDVGCVQYCPGRMSDTLEMINCSKMKSDLRAQRDFHHKWAAQNKMSHAADFGLLTRWTKVSWHFVFVCHCVCCVGLQALKIHGKGISFNWGMWNFSAEVSRHLQQIWCYMCSFHSVSVAGVMSLTVLCAECAFCPDRATLMWMASEMNGLFLLRA